MKEGRVYVVTHGKKGKGADPPLTEEGIQQIRALRFLLPEFPEAIVVGEGSRYHGSYLAANVSFEGGVGTSRTAGVPDSLEEIAGQQVVILGDGTQVPLEQYTDAASLDDALGLINNLPHGTAIIFGGRPFMIALGVEDARSASIYRVRIKDGQIAEILEIFCRIVG